MLINYYSNLKKQILCIPHEWFSSWYNMLKCYSQECFFRICDCCFRIKLFLSRLFLLFILLFIPLLPVLVLCWYAKSYKMLSQFFGIGIAVISFNTSGIIPDFNEVLTTFINELTHCVRSIFKNYTIEKMSFKLSQTGKKQHWAKVILKWSCSNLKRIHILQEFPAPGAASVLFC